MKNKLIKSALAAWAVSVTLVLHCSVQVSAASENNIVSQEANNKTTDEFIKAYETGRSKGILNNENMTKSNFIELCKKSVFPAYLEYSKDHPTVSFAQYIAEDNYEVPELQPGDHPTTIRATNELNNSSYSTLFPSFIAAHSGYSMKAGDILVCYGTNSMGKYVGHAAIATSSSYVLEMPGLFHKAEHHTKAQFFKQHSGGSNYVLVYRIKNHPKYADAASTYAYHYMYLKDNPDYLITTNLIHKSPSYCSKYVLLSYYWGATKSSVKTSVSGGTIVKPHDLARYWFKGSFKPSCIHKITSY